MNLCEGSRPEVRGGKDQIRWSVEPKTRGRRDQQWSLGLGAKETCSKRKVESNTLRKICLEELGRETLEKKVSSSQKEAVKAMAKQSPGSG